jgi:threonine dehydratase
MDGFPLDRLEAAAARVHAVMPPTPQYHWPLLSARVGAETWVKHENHTPLGAFKLRGGIVHLENLKRADPKLAGVIAATRGNHGQSIAFAAARVGVRAVIVVPHGNSVEKNAAMVALGAELIEHGHDFQAAFEHAEALAQARGLLKIESYSDDLVAGVASYALELFGGVAGLDTVYVPIGLGSGISGVMAARDALGLRTEVVGVVAENAAAYALSFAQKRAVSTNSADTIADGMACRVPNQAALAAIWAGTARIVRVSEDEIRSAMRLLFSATHNVAEGAAAAPLAAALKERAGLAGRRIALVMSGGNVDRAVFARVLSETEA